MKPEISKEEQREALLRWMETGEGVEYLAGDGLWNNLDIFHGVLRDSILRLKPTPKLRPWKPEEVPVGARLRRKNCEEIHCAMILGFTKMGVETTGASPISLRHPTLEIYSFEYFLENGEHSIDSGKTWLPCGVVE